MNENKKIYQYRKITYQGPVTDSLNKILTKYTLKAAIKTNNTTYNTLKNTKQRTDILEKNGVYKLTCNDCKAVYIGETGRNFKTRIKEHINNNNHNSNFGNHLKETGHHFNIKTNTTIMHIQEKNHKLTLLEAYEIYEQNKNKEVQCLNEQVNLFYTPIFKHL